MRTAISCTYYGYIALGIGALLLYVASLPLSLSLRAFSGTGALEGALVLAYQVERFEIGDKVVLPQKSPHASVYTLQGTDVEAGVTYLITEEGGRSLRAREAYGRIVYTIPVLGYVLTFAYSMFGVAALFVAPLLMVFAHTCADAVLRRRYAGQDAHEYTVLKHV